MIFTLWPESRLRDLLLQTTNRGLLLYYFETPDFDAAHCQRKTRTGLKNLGDRYQPDLHTPTDAEDILHTFLRGERARQQYVEEARTQLTDPSNPPPLDKMWGAKTRALHRAATKAWQEVVPLLGDGISLPASFADLKGKIDATVDALTPLTKALYALTPVGKGQVRNTPHGYFHQRDSAEESHHQCQQWSGNLVALSRYLEQHAYADCPCLLLKGAPGMGKTQVLAEICNRYAEQGGVVLFREAAAFMSSDTPWTQFLCWADFPGNGGVRDFLAALSAAAAGTGLPALVCIDALNETPDRNLWRNGLREFADEIFPFKNIKLLVSCRSDYLRQTLPPDIRKQRAPGWHCAEHHGLGVHLFEALPKYLAAYGVRGVGVPPMTAEFEVPLFLLTFCEAFQGDEPPPGSLSLGLILSRYAQRKADLLGQRINCDPGKVLRALRQLAKAMQSGGSLTLPEDEAQTICESLHAPTDTSRSLYRALLAESILAEIPAGHHPLGPQYVVRFTYERIWDYFLSLDLLPAGKAPDPVLLAHLNDPTWRDRNSGVVSLLTVRLAEEGRGELCDLVSPGQPPPHDLLEAFFDSLPWRTGQSVSKRTRELFEDAVAGGVVQHELEWLLRFAPNPAHPWNAHVLHGKLAGVPLAARDREWTHWINEEFIHHQEDSALHALLNWAERGRLDLLPDDHILLLATALAWCLSTTVVEARVRAANALTRLLANRLDVAAQIVERFLSVDDPYVQERVLLAAAGAAQHASAGDPGLARLAAAVHARVFAQRSVHPHILVRHCATEVCHQAEEKGALPAHIPPASFRPPFRSRWPLVWTARRVRALEKRLEKDRASSHRAYTVFRSIEPGPGVGYGDFGHYVMDSAVGYFQNRRLKVAPAPKEQVNRFDSQLAKRYVVQRIFKLGWDPTQKDQHPSVSDVRGSPVVERLSKKYQWIALHELLGYLSDHFHFGNFHGKVEPFRTAASLNLSHLLDPFVVETTQYYPKDFTWRFVPPASPWWRGHYHPLPRPFSHRERCEKAFAMEAQSPAILLELKDDAAVEWLALSCFHEWYEPQPLWLRRDAAPRVGMHWAAQSYLVKPRQAAKLIARAKQKDFPDQHSFWLGEPKFEGTLASLRTYPKGQSDLRDECELDNRWGSRTWNTAAWATTCRFDEDETHQRFPGGSFPSPQLAELGALRWTGQGFEFASGHHHEPLVRYHSDGFKGACVVKRAVLLEWLRKKDLRLVWRCFSEKHRYYEPPGEPSYGRYHWAAYTLNQDGEVALCGGGTSGLKNGLQPAEDLPW